MDATEQIKARLPLEDIVSEVVTLKPAGYNRLKGLCPFHAEKTPSFHVILDKGFYHCFGCSASGDLFSFVQQTQNLEFRDALELLAVRAGVELPEQGPNEARKRDLYDLNDLAQSYFTAQLAEHPDVQTYLTGRGLTPETVSAWGLGYAPEGWTNLTAHARTKGVELDTLVTAGLAKDKEGRVYDLFRNRVTIPIRDVFSRIVGFSGRTLGDDQAKYFNTPETPVFHKGDLLFGLERAKQTIKDSGAAIIVEGHLDVIALHQAGFTATVGAQSATSTEAQINALERLCVTQLYMAFDSDEAGQRATLKACDAVARRFIVKVVKLPNKDPAETVQEDPELFRTALKNAISEPRYRLERACEGRDTDTAQGQRQVLEQLKPAMSALDNPVAAEVRQEVVRKFGVSLAHLNTWLGDPHAASPSSPKVARSTRADLVKALRVNIAALVLSHEAQLEASCTRLRQVLPVGDPLAEFADCCADAHYDVTTIWTRLPEWPHVAEALAHLTRGVNLPLARLESELEKYTKLAGLPKPISCTVPPVTVLGESSTGQPTTFIQEKSHSNAPAAEQKRSRTPTDVCLELLTNPSTRTEAVERLVATFRPDIHEVQRQRWLTTTLNGSPISDAPEGYLLAEAIGLTAWAWDREVCGVHNLGAWAWIEIAREAREHFVHSRAA